MSQWARENPEAYAEIAALPPSQHNAALRDAIGYDPDRIRDEQKEERMSANTPSYELIKLWHHDSDYEYVQRLVQRAKQTNAPPDALFERHSHAGPTGQWATLSELPLNAPFRDRLRAIRRRAAEEVS